jgi:hypothetical protein
MFETNIVNYFVDNHVNKMFYSRFLLFLTNVYLCKNKYVIKLKVMADKQAFLYLANGEIVPVLPSNGVSFTLGELKKFVKGFVQMIYLTDERVMIINEEGKFNSSKHNDCATTLAKNVLTPGDFIVGDALITPIQFVN